LLLKQEPRETPNRPEKGHVSRRDVLTSPSLHIRPAIHGMSLVLLLVLLEDCKALAWNRSKQTDSHTCLREARSTCEAISNTRLKYEGEETHEEEVSGSERDERNGETETRARRDPRIDWRTWVASMC
jgi:hypothetical protein